MRIAVTGTAGFLGRHVATYLASQGHDVVGIDKQQLTDPMFPSIKGDFTDLPSLRQQLERSDVVCHLGAVGDVYLALEKPEVAAHANVVGSATVGQAAQDLGMRVVYASTWEVYGLPDYEPMDEEHPCRPEHPYSITKLAGEQMLRAASDLKGLPVVSLRLGTAYGPGLRANSVFAKFAEKARAGAPIVIQGDGSQGRQFTHALDIARAFELASTTENVPQVMNIASDEFTTIKELAQATAQFWGAEIVFAPQRDGEVPTGRVSSELAKRELGWKAEVAFPKGLEGLYSQWAADSTD